MSAPPAYAFAVALDARRWGRTGLGRYQAELYTHLRALAPSLRLTLLGAPPGVAEALAARWLPYEAALYSWREQALGGWIARRAGADLVHYPHYAVPRWAPRPYVVTIHDLIHFRFPGQFGARRVALARRVLVRAVGRAARVICVSDATRRDLLALVPGVADRIHVIHEGVSARFTPATVEEVDRVRLRYRLGTYLLSMGDRRPYKRHDVAIAAFRRLREAQPDLQLVVVGETTRAEVADPPGSHRLGYVTDEELRALYSGAACLLFPSAWEGFGLPVLEAMACGCPVVCGHGSALDEVAGDAACRVDASSPVEVADAARALLDDHQFRQGMVARGLAWAARFRWDTAAQATLEVLAAAARQR